MDQAKVKEVLAIYRTKLAELHILKRDIDVGERICYGEWPSSEFLAQCHTALECAEFHIQMDRIREAHRLLGIIQSIFWMTGVYTLEEIAEQNNMPGPWWACKDCGSQDHEKRNMNKVAREADIYCKSCGAFVREWNP